MNTFPAISYIRRHIAGLPDNELFKNRDFLIYASRRCVDWALHELCNQEYIVREARGVYRKIRAASPSPFEVALYKAAAFGRKMVTTFVDATKALGLSPRACENTDSELTFLTDGSTTSFRLTNGTVVNLRRSSPRKIALGDTTVGVVTKALWYLGQDALAAVFRDATRHFGRVENQELHRRVSEMPAWLADFVTAIAQKRKRSSKKSEFELRSGIGSDVPVPEEQWRPALSAADMTALMDLHPDRPILPVTDPNYDGQWGYDGDYAHLESTKEKSELDPGTPREFSPITGVNEATLSTKLHAG